MSSILSRTIVALACAIAAGMTPVMAQTTQPYTPEDQRDGTFKSVRGDVTVVRGDTRVAAIVGGPLFATDRIQTGPDGAMAVTLKDRSVLTLGPNSTADLSAFDFNPTTQDGNMMVRLLRGAARVTTGLIAKVRPEQVKVTTPTAVIGVRGTDFIVEVNQ